MKRLALPTLITLCFAVTCQAQVTDQQAQLIAASVTRSESGYPESKPLRTLRRQDLEDGLFRSQIKQVGKIQKAAYFYEVSTDGYFVLSPNEAIYVDSADGHLIWLVAVSVATGEPYRLFGFKNANNEFNRLAKHANIVIRDAQHAELYALTFLAAVEDPHADRIVSSSRGLRHKVEDYFFSNYADKMAERFYKRWWSGFSRTGSKVLFEPIASADPGGYEVIVPTISGSAEKKPQFKHRFLHISSTGLCEVKKTRIIYPRAD